MDDNIENECCFFNNLYECDSKIPCISNVGPARLHSIINASKHYEDGLFLQLEQELDFNTNLTISYHKNCISRYTSKTHIERAISRKSKCKQDVVLPSKRFRSETPSFEFNKHCLFCATPCLLERDVKHPDRWKEAYLFRSTLHCTSSEELKS